MAAQNKAWLDAAIAEALEANAIPGRRRIFAKGLRRFLKSESPLAEDTWMKSPLIR